MPTNDEKREVAEILRSGVGTTDCMSDDDFIDWVHGVVSRSRDGHILDRLADLIEPEERTCYVEHIDDDSFHLSCGHEAAGHVSPSFCPYCGAKVVE